MAHIVHVATLAGPALPHGTGLSDVGIFWFENLPYAYAGAFSDGGVLGLLTVPLAGLVNALVTSLTDGPFENPQIEVLAPTALSVPAMVGMLVLAAGVAPVVEEIVFRGVLYGWLRRFLSPAAGIVLSALVFGAVHGIPQLVPALAVQGVVLAMVYERTRSLWPSIVLHGVFNAVMLGALYGVTRATSVL